MIKELPRKETLQALDSFIILFRMSAVTPKLYAHIEERFAKEASIKFQVMLCLVDGHTREPDSLLSGAMRNHFIIRYFFPLFIG